MGWCGVGVCAGAMWGGRVCKCEGCGVCQKGWEQGEESVQCRVYMYACLMSLSSLRSAWPSNY